MTKNLTVTQNQLAIQNALNVADPCTGYASFNYGAAYWQWYYYGVIGGNYGGTTFSGIPGYARSTAIGGATNYVHMCNSYLTATYDWTAVNNYRTSTNNGFVAFFGDMNGAGNLGAYNSAASPLFNAGYVIANSAAPYTSNLNTAVSSTKVYQFLTTQGHTPISSVSGTFNGDGTSTDIPTIPAGAVPVLTKSNGLPRLIIDPVNNFIYCGDCQTFDGGTAADGRATFDDNLMYYIANAAKYGTNFTDMFIEDGQPNAAPAPWDPIWGANAGVPSK